jgi:hypothetical protein
MDANMSLLDGPTTCNWLEGCAVVTSATWERIARLVSRGSQEIWEVHHAYVACGIF